MQGIATSSLAEALDAARALQAQGYTIFRGQLQRWPVLPSLWRIDREARMLAQRRLERFADWARITPGLEEDLADPDILTAIAQHHGIATPFLDVTTAPQVAAFFAQDGAPKAGEGVILAWRAEEIEAIDRLRLVRLDVPNLWRLDSQHGAFLVAESEDALRALSEPVVIRFPHGSALPADLPQRSQIYPERASALEVMLTEFFNRLRQDENTDLTKGAQHVHTLRVQDWGPRLSAFRAHSPPVGAGWVEAYQARDGLFTVEREAFEDLKEVAAKAPDRRLFQSLPAHFKALCGRLSRLAPRFMGDKAPRPAWSLRFLKEPGLRQRYESALNDLSDRLRFSDLDTGDWAQAHGLVIAVAREAGGDWKAVDEATSRLLGEVYDIEIRSLSGSRHFGKVSAMGLREAYDPGVLDAHLPYYRRKSEDDAMMPVTIGVQPGHIFEYQAFKRLLIREIAPLITISEAIYVPSAAEPERKGYGGLHSLRALNVSAVTVRGDFNKPFHMFDPHAVDAIFLMGDMSEEEVFAQGQAAVLSALQGAGMSKFVRLTDYQEDSGEPVWSDPAAQTHAAALIRAGALFAIQPTTCLVFGDQMPDPRQDAFGIKGWGGLELVALGQGVCDAFFEGDAETIQSVADTWQRLRAEAVAAFTGQAGTS